MSGLFGAAYWLEVHALWFFIFNQACGHDTSRSILTRLQFVGGLFQSTGWPTVVAIMGNWFPKGKHVQSISSHPSKLSLY